MTYLVEITERDESNNIVSGKVLYQISMASGKPRGKDVMFLSGDGLINPKFSLDNDGNPVLIEDSEKEKELQIQAAYDSMVSDIYTQMESVFGTKNDVSASAFAATWEAMKKRPANYVDNELGLADEAAVTAYADSKLADADAYGVYRLKRITQYHTEKEGIENA